MYKEMQKPSSVPKDEYKSFLANDEELAEQYGRNYGFFKRNKSEVDLGSVDYQYIKKQETIGDSDEQQMKIVINNPYGLKLRLEKQIAEVLDISRNSVLRLLEQETIRVEENSAQIISILVGCSCLL